MSCRCSWIVLSICLAVVAKCARREQIGSTLDCSSSLIQNALTTSRARLEINEGFDVGILFIYDKKEVIGPGTYGNMSVALASHWAAMHGYKVFFAEEPAPPNRATQWNKIVAVQKHLPLVDLLIVMDYDVFIVDYKRTAEELLLGSSKSCKTMAAEMPVMETEVFGWFGVGYEDHFDNKVLRFQRHFPLNAGFFGLRNVPRAFQFLQDTWKRGDGTELSWKFPREQAAMEDVAAKSIDYSRRICLVPQEMFSLITLESPEHVRAHTEVFAWHATGVPQPLKKLGVKKEQRRFELARTACHIARKTVAAPLVCT